MAPSGLLHQCCRFAIVAVSIASAAGFGCGSLGSTCTVFSSIGCPRRQGICKTRNGCLVRSGCTSSFDKKSFFDRCVCNPAGSSTTRVVTAAAPLGQTPVVHTSSTTTAIVNSGNLGSSQNNAADPTSKCGGLGRVCTLKRGCNGQKGICKTKNGFLDRSAGSSTFDKKGFFDKCVCTPPGDEKVLFVPGKVFVFLATIAGLLAYYIVAYRFPQDQVKIPQSMHVCLGLGAFYSVFSFGFSLAVGSKDDFFTGGSFTFVLLILAMGTIGGVVKGCREFGFVRTALMLIGAFCTMAGFFAFTFSLVCVCILGIVIFSAMSLVIRCLRSGWTNEEIGDIEEVGAGQHLSEARQLAKGAASPEEICFRRRLNLVGGFLQRFAGVFMRLVNFVMQVTLIAFSIGDIKGTVDKVKAQLRWSFDLSLRTPDFPEWGGELSNAMAAASALVNEIAEGLSNFMLNYTNFWTPNKIVAYTSIGVFEIFVVAAVFVIVLSDFMLILSPRPNTGRIAMLVVDLVSRGMLYTLQGLVSASNALLLTLLWVKPINRPELSASQKFFNQTTEAIGTPLTLFYVGLVLLVALYFLLKLWSGADAGLQNVSTKLLNANGVRVHEIQAGRPSTCAFVFAFFGIWSQHTLDAFEVQQRAQAFQLGVDEVLLATVNALSFPLYIIPFGSVVAKLGEYLNQSPIYIYGRGFQWSSLFLSFAYLAEYILVLVTCKELLDASEAGIADTQAASQSNENVPMLNILACFITLAIIRAIVAGIRDCLARSAKLAEPSPRKEAWPETKQTSNVHPVEVRQEQDAPEKVSQGNQQEVESTASTTSRPDDLTSVVSIG